MGTICAQVFCATEFRAWLNPIPVVGTLRTRSTIRKGPFVQEVGPNVVTAFRGLCPGGVLVIGLQCGREDAVWKASMLAVVFDFRNVLVALINTVTTAQQSSLLDTATLLLLVKVGVGPLLFAIYMNNRRRNLAMQKEVSVPAVTSHQIG